MTTEEYIQQEVSLKVLEWQSSDIYKKIERIDQKIDNKFHWFYGLMIAGIIVPKLIELFHLK